MTAPILDSQTEPPALGKRAFFIICAMSAATALGNTGLISVLPAIGRSIGIPDPLVAAIFALSAIGWATMSPVWARASDRFGRKPLMMIGVAGIAISMTLCGIVVSAGLHHLAPPMVIFACFLLARSLFGFIASASNPAAQAYVVERTPIVERTQAIANLAGAFALGTVLGPFLAPLFILPVVGLAGPLFGFAGLSLIVLAVVGRFLEEAPIAAAEPENSAAETAGKGTPIWRDQRITPFLIYGFIVAACQTAQAQSLGFLIIDKLGVSPTKAQAFIAIAMMFGAVAGLLAQWGLIRMFQMTPRQLLRWGAGLAAAGNLIVALSPDYLIAVVGFVLSSLGVGFSRPGFTAGASLAVNMSEQARVAGAIAAVNGINVVLAPLFIMLYERDHAAPFLLTTFLLVAMTIYAFRSKALCGEAPKPATRADTVIATLERSDEGGV